MCAYVVLLLHFLTLLFTIVGVLHLDLCLGSIAIDIFLLRIDVVFIRVHHLAGCVNLVEPGSEGCGMLTVGQNVCRVCVQVKPSRDLICGFFCPIISGVGQGKSGERMLREKSAWRVIICLLGQDLQVYLPFSTEQPEQPEQPETRQSYDQDGEF